MKRGMILLGILVLVGIVAFVGSAQFSYGKGKPVKACCIAGTYDGTYADTPSKICPRPGTGKFIMDITQANCDPKIAGKVVNPANGETYKLDGTVTPEGKCCRLEGELHGVSGTIVGKVMKFKGTLCKDRLGKWYCKDGVYTAVTPPGCGGKFTLKQK
jgi:uncharacterized protein (DUF2147 family)